MSRRRGLVVMGSTGSRRYYIRRRRPDPLAPMHAEMQLAGERFAEFFASANALWPGQLISFQRKGGMWHISIGGRRGVPREGLADALRFQLAEAAG